ncbi:MULTISPECIES: type II secretion system protein [unclassified Moraxella]|uniref:type II secretion system protein n=1 Tax=unclassified Moraxella TaxID=2685852 RepID=UPI003AF4D1F3
MPSFAPITKKPPHQHGFTLVEIMVVIVIMTIFAGMMTLSVSGSDNRKNMAFYEHLQSNLTHIRLLASEQMQPYGLAIKLAQGDNPSQLMVVKLTNANSSNPTNSTTTNTKPTAPSWQLEKQIPPLDVPNNITVNIQTLDTMNNMLINQQAPNWLVGNQAPPVVWFGTGEATPVQISLQKTNPNDSTVYPIGQPIIINQFGAVELAK